MEWLKKNYDRFALLCFAVLLLALSLFLIMRALAFQHVFDGISGKVVINRNIPPVDASLLNRAKQALQDPFERKVYKTKPPLFVSEKYIVFENKLINPRVTNRQFHPPIPNDWFFVHELDPLDPNALEDDPSGDGFTNLEKWTWDKDMDPRDAKQHPPYWTKLRLARFIKIPFRLKFEAYDGDTFQINTIDLRQPSQFLHVGEQIAGTKFKIVSFEKKSHVDANGVTIDDSELTILNTENQLPLILVLDKIVDSPDSYALFRYLWKGEIDIQVKKDKTFSINPEPDVQYKLIDINEAQALIESTKTGERIKITASGAERTSNPAQSPAPAKAPGQ